MGSLKQGTKNTFPKSSLLKGKRKNWVPLGTVDATPIREKVKNGKLVVAEEYCYIGPNHQYMM